MTERLASPGETSWSSDWIAWLYTLYVHVGEDGRVAYFADAMRRRCEDEGHPATDCDAVARCIVAERPEIQLPDDPRGSEKVERTLRIVETCWPSAP